MGAWIEIKGTSYELALRLSLLSWERGLKLPQIGQQSISITVAPLVGAWIEIDIVTLVKQPVYVAPLVGAWIEISRIYLIALARCRRSSRGSVD